ESWMDTTMDAITKKKTLSGVLVTLMVGAAFVGLVTAFTPLAQAAATDATVFHADQSYDTCDAAAPPCLWDAGGYGNLDETSPDLQFNHSYNLKIANVCSRDVTDCTAAFPAAGSVTATTGTDTYKLCQTTQDNLSTACYS